MAEAARKLEEALTYSEVELTVEVKSPSGQDRPSQLVRTLRAGKDVVLYDHDRGIRVMGVWKGIVPWAIVRRAIF